ncbi:MAG: hypothetical protein ACXQS5_06300 [Candidatus Methanospirareceae archaeon]
MIDRSKAFWAWVWDGSNDHRAKRFVVDSIDGKNCIAVSLGDEHSYSNGGHVSFLGWEHYERIPEPKKRPMTRKEILGFIAWNPHIVVRIQDEPPQVSNKFNFIRDMQMYSWAPITEAGEIGEWNKFEVSDES